jgi:hypothetical protein
MSKIEEKDTDKGCHFARERENLLRPKLLTKYIGRFFQEVLSDTSTNNICRSKVVSVTNRKGGGNVSERNWRVIVWRSRLNNAFNGFGTNDVYKIQFGSGRSASKRDTGRSLSIIIIITKTQPGRAGVSIWTDYLSGLLGKKRRADKASKMKRNPHFPDKFG